MFTKQNVSLVKRYQTNFAFASRFFEQTATLSVNLDAQPIAASHNVY
jgi:hypothetical protein